MKLLSHFLILIFWAIILPLISNANSNNKEVGAFDFHATYTADNLMNFKGGIKTGYAYLGFATLDARFDFEEARLWRGANAYLMGASTHGAEPTAILIGDFQAVSNIEAGDLIYLQELWYSQQLGNFTVTAGLQDLNVEFLASEYGSLYINSSFGIISTVADNIPSPIFPLTGLGLTLKYRMNEIFEVKGALYDGHMFGFEENPHNTHWNLKPDEGVLGILEGAYQTNKKRNGTYKLGAYVHTKSPLGDAGENHCRNVGVYSIIDRQLFSNSVTGRALAMFAQLGISSPKYNNNFAYAGMGFNYKGLSPKYPDNELGLALATSFFKNHVNTFESTVELTYSAQLTENIRIQPDFQYVINPSGTNMELINAMVGIVRVEISF